MMGGWLLHCKVLCEAWLYVTIILAFVLPQGVLVMGLQLESLFVPESGLRGGSEMLQCNFTLGSETLYSLKWYKDGHEFFRIVSKNGQLSPIETFPRPGVHVVHRKSDLHRVTLTNLTLESSGTYRCEASAEKSFRTVSKEGNLTVIVPPEKEKPTISNISNMYLMGDTVSGNCTSYRSKPAASLSFHIHNTKVEGSLLTEYGPVSEPGGLQTSILGLHFVVGNQHFRRGVLLLRCTATIGKRRWSEERVIEHRNFYNSHVASAGQRGYSSGSHSKVDGVSLLVVTLLSCTLDVNLLISFFPFFVNSLSSSSSWWWSSSTSSSLPYFHHQQLNL